MPKFFVKEDQIKNNEIIILGEDINHIINVLRLKTGDEIRVCIIENNKNYIVKINEVSKIKLRTKIIKEVVSRTEPLSYIHVFQGLPKSDKMELIIQKSTELGVKEITPVQMERTVVKLNEKDIIKKEQRWQKIAEVAAKQSDRDIIPKINKLTNLKNIYELFRNYDIVLVTYENEKYNTLKKELKKLKKEIKFPKIAVVIGPEGGIDLKEIQKLQLENCKIVTLGNRILRTETVAISIISIILYEFEGD